MGGKLLFLLVFLTVLGAGLISQASELYIDPAGKVRISDAEITYLNNNVITVTLWGTRWVFYINPDPSFSRLTNASGETIAVPDLQKGHRIYVEGEIKDVGVGKMEINVVLLRDASIQGTLPVLSLPLVKPQATASILQSVLPVPKPISASVVQLKTETASIVASPSAKYLTRGMAGSDVKKIQETLLAQGYLKDDEVSGFFGEATERAVKKLQKANGLSQEGTVGPLTRKVLGSLSGKSTTEAKIVSAPAVVNSISAPASSVQVKASGKSLTTSLRTGMRGKEVVILQEFLQSKGFGIPNDGPVTGVYGQVTEKAVSKFQQANGLEAVGFVGPSTRELINKLLVE
ncbi:MAG: peptidoglycan-binding protein [bacterium]|nr:peptidoglycan-binding protein [bacterium]